MTTLWDITGSDVVKALAAERRAGGAVASGLVLTLIVVTGETQVAQAEAAATIAASQHPCRLLIVVRRNVSEQRSRLDAEVQIGGRLGPGEAVVLRMNGRLALHAESVVLPLLAADAPVVTWWFGAPPDLIAHDPLGVLASRRITDVRSTPDPLGALRGRAKDYAPGDTDLAWTRITPWRSVLAGAWDTVIDPPTTIEVEGAANSTSTALLAAWLGSRFGREVTVTDVDGESLCAVRLTIGEGDERLDVSLRRQNAHSGVLTRTGQTDRMMPLPQLEYGDLIGEELRRLDDDPVYAASLERLDGERGLSSRSRRRTHLWRDPAEEAAARQ